MPKRYQEGGDVNPYDQFAAYAEQQAMQESPYAQFARPEP